MAQLIGIVIIFLIIGAFHVISEIIKGLTAAANETGKALDDMGKRSLNAVGRKNEDLLKIHPFIAHAPSIPAEYRSWHQKLADLKSWSPKFTALPQYRPATYAPVKLEIRQKLEFSLLEHDVDALLLPAQISPSLYDVLKREINSSAYPTSAPLIPPVPEKPKTIEPLLGDIPEPRLQLPLYRGVLSLLNPFVKNAHEKELQQVHAAKLLRERLLSIAAEANPKIVTENANAIERWKASVKLHEHAGRELRERHVQASTNYSAARAADLAKIEALQKSYREQSAEGVMAHFHALLSKLDLPEFIPRKWRIQYDSESRIIVLEHQFPDLARLHIDHEVSLKSGSVRKPVAQRARKELISRIQSALSIRLAYELAVHDYENALEAITINGWAEFIDKRTGEDRVAYCSTLFAKKTDLVGLKLVKVDPISAFRALRGNSANESYEITPIAPIMRLNTSDPRFVPPREVLGKMTEGENLAAMDWEDFEHLIRELFQKAFSFPGAEVKVTQASRDKGVDAVAFNPDPIQGGKIIIQAKRYTNTVDVSAVRDLYGAVLNEGAMKGILVTTSHFGSDAYQFATGKPISLVNGAELLGLLEKFGYKFRIDMDEARRLSGL